MSASKSSKQGVTPNSKAEQAMMDSLLAGLDASVFDPWEVSPVRPTSARSSQVSPLRQKRHSGANCQEVMLPPGKRSRALSPKKASQVDRKPVGVKMEPVKPERGRSPVRPSQENKRGIVAAFPRAAVKLERSASPRKLVKQEPMAVAVKQEIQQENEVKRDVKMEVDVKAEMEVDVQTEIKPTISGGEVLSPKKEVPEFADEDMYDVDFDFDLGDLSTLDESLIAPLPPRIKYPIIHPTVPPCPEGYAPTPWARCMVDGVLDGLHFQDGVIPHMSELEKLVASGSSFSKTLVVTVLESGTQRVVHLQGRWADTPVKKDDIVNIVSTSLSNPSTTPIVITFKDPSTFLVHHPDLMLTMTSIANAMPCPRKPLIQQLIKTPGPPSKPVMYGNLLHSLLQGALAEQDFDAGGTFRRLDGELKKEERRLEIWSTGMGVLDVREEVGMKAGKGFESFGGKWVGEEPRSHGELHSPNGETPALLAINGLHEVEEDIWSPKWGLKGKVDASVQAKVVRDPTKLGEAEEHVAPLEIKTGRSVGVMAHRAQTMLYTLLMEDRYGVPVPAGLLYYSQLDSILRVEAKPIEIRALVMTRNELADWLSKKRRVPRNSPEADVQLAMMAKGMRALPVPVERQTGKEEEEGEGMVEDIEEAFLPPTIDHPRECKMCYAVDSCMLYRKAIDKVEPHEDDPIAELYAEKTGHMTDKDAEFYKKWDTLLTVEEQDISRFRSQLWTMNAKKREKNGRCFSDMIIDSYSNDIGKSLAKIHRHTYTFVRAPLPPSDSSSQTTSSPSLLSGHIARGDPVSLSIEPDLLCLSRGFITELTATSVTIGVTYVIDVDALLKRTARSHRVLKQGEGGADGEGKVVFRIDKDEMASGMMRMRNNLAQLFYPEGDTLRRGLIVDLDPPAFEPSWRPDPEEIPGHMNPDQAQAMVKVLTARDYALILGMPGTGKTSTIAEIIKALVARGKSVLLTSYTHSAVDTILMKLMNAEFGVLRLGNIDKVHPDVQHFTLEALESSSNMAQLDARLMKPPVVAATCLAIDHPLFFRRRFDYCIVDEASQITLPTCIGPLRMADKFVLVGDHFQLPPIVRHPEARRGGLDVSLFRLLSSAHPDAVTDLSFQYRMNEDIMALSNKLVYEGRLKCGNEEVASRGLKLKKRKTCGEVFGDCGCTERGDAAGGKCWVQDILDESVKCVFIDTDGLPALDSRVGDLVQNEVEAQLVAQLATALTSSGLRQEDLAVITPYRQQIKLLSGMLQPMPRVEILTADKSQGRDKDCILISLVRSNDTGNIGDLLKDWRRINVSFTRAKKKLVIIASAKTLGADPLLKEFLELVREKGWVKKLKKGDDKLHVPRVVKAEEAESGAVVLAPAAGAAAGGTRGVKDREKKVVKGGMGVLNGKGVFAKEIMGMD
ncbi:hypothetical protein IAT38_004039 [Cryptococcus sp. DSM 104549]